MLSPDAQPVSPNEISTLNGQTTIGDPSIIYGDDIGAKMFQEYQNEIARLRRENN